MQLDKFGADDISIKVYDPSKQKLIATYNNYTEAARKLGLTYKVVYTACANKTRRFSPFLNKEVAIRVAAKQKT
jgi:hypothetical protein